MKNILCTTIVLVCSLFLLEARTKPQLIGESITGHFIQGAKLDTAKVYLFEVDSSIRDFPPVYSYIVRFSNTLIKPIVADGRAVRLVNEGDLDGDGFDDISLYCAPQNGCTYNMLTYSCKKGYWQLLIEPLLIPTACTELNDDEIQNKVFNKNGNIYYDDIVSENEKFIHKIKVALPPHNPDEWQLSSYCNYRFDFCIKYPKTFLKQPQPTNGDGQIFISYDIKVEIRSFGRIKQDENDNLDKEVSLLTQHIIVSYKQKVKDGFIYSGINSDGNIVYAKTISVVVKNYMGSRQSVPVFKTLMITYPKSQQNDYDSYCKIIADSW